MKKIDDKVILSVQEYEDMQDEIQDWKDIAQERRVIKQVLPDSFAIADLAFMLSLFLFSIWLMAQ